MVEELLSRSGAMGKETAKSIADAAMLEVAGISMGHMVHQELGQTPAVSAGTCVTSPFSPQEPDEFYEGITFEHFLKVGICGTRSILSEPALMSDTDLSLFSYWEALKSNPK